MYLKWMVIRIGLNSGANVYGKGVCNSGDCRNEIQNKNAARMMHG